MDLPLCPSNLPDDVPAHAMAPAAVINSAMSELFSRNVRQVTRLVSVASGRDDALYIAAHARNRSEGSEKADDIAFPGGVLHMDVSCFSTADAAADSDDAALYKAIVQSLPEDVFNVWRASYTLIALTGIADGSLLKPLLLKLLDAAPGLIILASSPDTIHDE